MINKAFLRFLALLMVFLAAAVNAAAQRPAEQSPEEHEIRFGMTPQEVRDYEILNDRRLTRAEYGFASYQLHYYDDIYFGSVPCVRLEYDFGMYDNLLYQYYYVTGGGLADYLYIKEMISGKYGEPLTDPDGMKQYSVKFEQLRRRNTEVSHWLIPGETDSLGIDLWYNHYDTVFAVFYKVSD